MKTQTTYSPWQRIFVCTECGRTSEPLDFSPVCPECGSETYDRKIGRWKCTNPVKTWWEDLIYFLVGKWTDTDDTLMELEFKPEKTPCLSNEFPR